MERPVKCVSWHRWQQDGVEVGTIVILVNRPDLLFNFVNLSCLNTASDLLIMAVCVLISISALNVKMMNAAGLTSVDV